MSEDQTRLQPSAALRRLSVGMAMALAASGRTQREVADQCGISTAYLSKVLAGAKNPSQKVIAMIAEAVSHTVGEIYDLGDQAIDRENEASRREALRRAGLERTVATMLELADHLDLADLESLLRGLERKISERKKESSFLED